MSLELFGSPCRPSFGTPSHLNNVPAGGLTISAFILQLTAPPGANNRIIDKSINPTPVGNQGWFFGFGGSGGDSLRFRTGTGSTTSRIWTLNNILGIGVVQWVGFSIPAVVSGAVAARFFVDGAFVGSVNNNAASSPGNDSGIRMGLFQPDTVANETPNLLIADIRMWNTQLSDDEIAHTYHARGGARWFPNLVAHYALSKKADDSQITATDIQDQSPFQNHQTEVLQNVTPAVWRPGFARLIH